MSKKKKKGKKTKRSFTPEQIVERWHKAIEKALDDRFLEKECFDVFEPKLRQNIADLMKAGKVFTEADMKNSEQVARDAAKICRLLQPSGHRKEVRFDTFEAVLDLCATHHLVCQTGRGAGGWCTV